MSLSPQQLQQYTSAFQQMQANPGAAGNLAQTGGGPMLGMTNFFNTPAYNLAYGANYNLNPSERFANDPGVQMAVNNGQESLKRQFASQGLGSSGALAQGLTQHMYDNYGAYIGGQENLFNNYQNQLSALSQFGAGQTGANQISQNANTMAQMQYGTGGQMANNYMQSGQNISQLLANQGAFNAGSILNTGAAQANNVYQGNMTAAQIYGNLFGANAGTASSALQGQGAQAGASQLGRLF